MRLSLSRVAVFGCVALGLGACERRDDPVEPQTERARASQTDTRSEPAYVFRVGGTDRDIRIPLQVDASVLVVETASDEDAVAAITDQGLAVGSTRSVPHAAEGHRVVRLAPGTSAEEIQAAAEALRGDARVRFVGHAYTTERGDSLALVNRLVVRFRDGVSAGDVGRLVEGAGLGVLREADPTGAKPTWWLSYPRDRNPLEVAWEVHGHPLVKWAEPDRLGRATPSNHIPSDPSYGDQYYLNNSVSLSGVAVDINVEHAWLETKGSSDITVAVLGSGIDGSHPELTSRRKSGPCHPGWDEAFENDFTGGAWDTEVRDCSTGNCTSPEYPDHETAVAGIIAAQHNGVGTVGIAPGVMLVSARTILPPTFATAVTPAQEADAINWAWDTCGADVVNGSYENPLPSSAVADAIADGVASGRFNRGTVFVFAGGNVSDRDGGTLHPVAYPAAYPEAIAVGAIDRESSVTNYSPIGTGFCPPGFYCVSPLFDPAEVDLVAPSGHCKLGTTCTETSAADVHTTDIAGSEGECSGNYMPSFTGTSATAPQVAAAAALLLSVDDDLTWTQVKSQLCNNADTWGSSTEFGCGKLNIAAALGISIAPITNVSIGGTLEVKPNVSCMWVASASGGTPPYAFEWFKNDAWVGSGSSISLNTGTTSFTLRLDVEDVNEETDTTSVGVTVSSGAGPCIS